MPNPRSASAAVVDEFDDVWTEAEQHVVPAPSLKAASSSPVSPSSLPSSPLPLTSAAVAVSTTSSSPLPFPSSSSSSTVQASDSAVDEWDAVNAAHDTAASVPALSSTIGTASASISRFTPISCKEATRSHCGAHAATRWQDLNPSVPLVLIPPLALSAPCQAAVRRWGVGGSAVLSAAAAASAVSAPSTAAEMAPVAARPDCSAIRRAPTAEEGSSSLPALHLPPRRPSPRPLHGCRSQLTSSLPSLLCAEVLCVAQTRVDRNDGPSRSSVTAAPSLPSRLPACSPHGPLLSVVPAHVLQCYTSGCW